MNMPTRVSTVAAALSVTALLGSGCDGLFDTGRELQQTPPVTTSRDASVDMPPEVPPPTCRAVTPDPAIDYPAMCRHYCDTLDETSRYLALSRGEAPADAGNVSQICYELRCVPKCVDQALCLTQCEAAATQYVAVCANAQDAGSNPVCPSSSEDHDARCRAGCSPPAPPPSNLD